MTAMETLLATSFEKTFTGFVNDDDITKNQRTIYSSSIRLHLHHH